MKNDINLRLIEAVKKNNFNKVKELIEKGEDVNFIDDDVFFALVCG